VCARSLVISISAYMVPLTFIPLVGIFFCVLFCFCSHKLHTHTYVSLCVCVCVCVCMCMCVCVGRDFSNSVIFLFTNTIN